MNAESALTHFQVDAPVISCAPYGNGHINETSLAVTQSGRRYVLQKINRSIFRDVPGLMANIRAVTEHLRAGADDPRRVLTLVPTLAGDAYYESADGDCFRLYDFVEGSLCLERAQSESEFAASGEAFGAFQKRLADFPAHTLSEVIPHFHDTPARFEQLENAIAQNAANRARFALPEIDFALERKARGGEMTGMRARGELPLRVTHNDTKLNNVLLDAVTRRPLCVIDLDTVMPGLAANDFGDSIRFGASTASEDERDLSKVTLSLSLFKAYAQGFLSACGKSLTPLEIETLPLGAYLMTLECGIRFLADYLNGDTYFHVAREGHNLDRCRTQFALIADMEAKWGRMADIVRACGASA